jgi:hypothetical protein
VASLDDVVARVTLSVSEESMSNRCGARAATSAIDSSLTLRVTRFIARLSGDGSLSIFSGSHVNAA